MPINKPNNHVTPLKNQLVKKLMNLDEILTGTIGFIIAMVIIGTAIGGAIYGYYTYAQHQILENYLWPVVEAVLAQGGGYWLAVINTGHEPLFVKYLIYPNGQSQTVNSGTLYQNQHWMTQLSQLPTEVMVCSAVNPNICVMAPVHGWYVANTNTATFNGPGSSGLIEVMVNDPSNAGWSVTWSYAGQSYSMSQSQSYTWWLNPPYVPIQISFTAKITQNPTGYTCQIQPSSITNTYGPGSVQEFNVTCSLAPITVTVNDQYGAGWNITWSGAASGSQSGSSSTSWTINPTSNGTITFTASITSTPSGYSSCSITPQTTSALPGQSVTFTISCSGGTSGGGGSSSYTVTVYVYAPSGVSWTTYLDEDDAGAIFYVDYWSGTGNGGPYTATVSSGITYLFSVKNLPSGCTASGSPYGIGQTFTPSGSFTEKITISCSSTTSSPPTTYGCFFTLSLGANPSGASSGVSSSPSPGTYFIQSGQSLSGSISAQSSVGSGSSWYEFDDWTLSYSGTGTFDFNGAQVSSGSIWNYAQTKASFEYICPSGLTQNVTATFKAVANYYSDSITLSGSTSISLSGSGTYDTSYTLSWSVNPYSAYQVSWSLPTTGNSFQVKAVLSTSGGSYTAGPYSVNLSCSSGTLSSASETFTNGQTSLTQSVSGSTGSTSATVEISYTCSSGLVK